MGGREEGRRNNKTDAVHAPSFPSIVVLIRIEECYSAMRLVQCSNIPRHHHQQQQQPHTFYAPFTHCAHVRLASCEAKDRKVLHERGRHHHIHEWNCTGSSSSLSSIQLNSSMDIYLSPSQPVEWKEKYLGTTYLRMLGLVCKDAAHCIPTPRQCVVWIRNVI